MKSPIKKILPDIDLAADAAYDQAHFPFIPAGMRGEVSGDWEVDGVEEIE